MTTIDISRAAFNDDTRLAATIRKVAKQAESVTNAWVLVSAIVWTNPEDGIGIRALDHSSTTWRRPQDPGEIVWCATDPIEPVITWVREYVGGFGNGR